MLPAPLCGIFLAVFHRRLCSMDGHLPTKAFFQQRSSSSNFTKGWSDLDFFFDTHTDTQSHMLVLPRTTKMGSRKTLKSKQNKTKVRHTQLVITWFWLKYWEYKHYCWVVYDFFENIANFFGSTFNWLTYGSIILTKFLWNNIFRRNLIFMSFKNHVFQLKLSKLFFNDPIFYVLLPGG